MKPPARRRIPKRNTSPTQTAEPWMAEAVRNIVALREKSPYLRHVKSRIGIIGNEWFVLRLRYGARVYRAFEAIGENPSTIFHYEQIYLHETEPRLSTKEIETLARKRLKEAGIIVN